MSAARHINEAYFGARTESKHIQVSLSYTYMYITACVTQQLLYMGSFPDDKHWVVAGVTMPPANPRSSN